MHGITHNALAEGADFAETAHAILMGNRYSVIKTVTVVFFRREQKREIKAIVYVVLVYCNDVHQSFESATFSHQNQKTTSHPS